MTIEDLLPDVMKDDNTTDIIKLNQYSIAKKVVYFNNKYNNKYGDRNIKQQIQGSND